jgi:hypothetical protein
MAHVLAQVRFRRGNNLPEDVVINTFHFNTLITQTPETAAPIIATRLKEFYRVPVAPSSFAVQRYMSQLLSNSGHEIRMYNLDLPAPRPVLYSEFFDCTFQPSQYPAEVALVLSFAAPFLPGVNPASRRGRVFIGPISTATSGGYDSDIRPTPEMRFTWRDAGLRLASYLTDAQWQVWSPTRGTGGPVRSVSVDDAFDTQRRRGGAPTNRITATVADV